MNRDGTGYLRIRFSKTDQLGEGAILFISRETLQNLEAIRPQTFDPNAKIFGVGNRTIARRVARTCLDAGAGQGFSGHSGRVGMAIDLDAAGVELPALMKAGRWDTPTMPVRYIRKQEASRGAVSRYHGQSSRGPRMQSPM